MVHYITLQYKKHCTACEPESCGFKYNIGSYIFIQQFYFYFVALVTRDIYAAAFSSATQQAMSVKFGSKWRKVDEVFLDQVPATRLGYMHEAKKSLLNKLQS